MLSDVPSCTSARIRALVRSTAAASGAHAEPQAPSLPQPKGAGAAAAAEAEPLCSLGGVGALRCGNFSAARCGEVRQQFLERDCVRCGLELGMGLPNALQELRVPTHDFRELALLQLRAQTFNRDGHGSVRVCYSARQTIFHVHNICPGWTAVEEVCCQLCFSSTFVMQCNGALHS